MFSLNHDLRLIGSQWTAFGTELEANPLVGKTDLVTGHNHFADCMCGWCIGGWRNHGSRSASEQRREPFWAVRWTYDSFTIPNVRCRFCNALVFYHEAWNGGRVFFDALGPPWQKHQCMGTASDEPPPLLSAEERSAIAAPAPAWQSHGWTPIAVEYIGREDEWHVLKCHRLEDGSFLRLLSTSAIDGIRRAPTLLSQMSECGHATISYLHPDGTPREASVYDYGSHCLSSPMEAEQARFANQQGSASQDVDGTSYSDPA